MSGPDQRPTAEQPTVQQPEVSADTTLDRPGSPWYRSGIPSHLGRARTSTVVLSLLFLAIGTLYLQIRPDPPGRTPVSDTGTEQPAETTDVPETTAPEETTEPAPTTGSATTAGSPSTPTRTTTSTPDTTPSAPGTTPDDDTPTTSEPDGQTDTGTGSPSG